MLAAVSFAATAVSAMPAIAQDADLVFRNGTIWTVDVDNPRDIELRKRRAWAKDGSSVSLEEIALDSLHWEDQTQIQDTGSFMATECPAPFAAQFAEVEVDTDTGQVTVKKLVMAVDCGVAINPITASGQVD